MLEHNGLDAATALDQTAAAGRPSTHDDHQPDGPAIQSCVAHQCSQVRLLTETEAAACLSISAGWLGSLRRAGLGPAYLRSGRRCFYMWMDLETWAAEAGVPEPKLILTCCAVCVSRIVGTAPFENRP